MNDCRARYAHRFDVCIVWMQQGFFQDNDGGGSR